MCVLPANTERIVGFFQEFTLYVDGLGHCCSYAYFPGMHSFGNAKVHFLLGIWFIIIIILWTLSLLSLFIYRHCNILACFV